MCENSIFVFVVVFTFVFVCAQGSPIGHSDSIPQADFANFNLKIVGGMRATRHEYPFQAALFITKKLSENFYLCGGTLISPVWVITSAFCVSDLTTIGIFVGVWNISKALQLDSSAFFSSAEKTFVHPCYLRNSYTGTNLGLVKLLRPARDIAPACLPNSFHTDWDRLTRGERLTDCVATGFGVTDVGRQSEILQQVRFSNVSTSKCREAYRDAVSTDKICAFGHHHQDTCGGDIGGPLLCRSSIHQECNNTYIAGVTLAGSSICGDSRIPGMYSAIFPHVGWIKHTMSESNSSFSTAECGNSVEQKGVRNLNSSDTPSVNLQTAP